MSQRHDMYNSIQKGLAEPREPELMAMFSAERLQAMNGDERFELLDDVRRSALAPVFAGFRALAANVLEPAALRSLERRPSQAVGEVRHA